MITSFIIEHSSNLIDWHKWYDAEFKEISFAKKHILSLKELFPNNYYRIVKLTREVVQA